MGSKQSIAREAQAALESAGVEVIRFHCMSKLLGHTQALIDGKHGPLAHGETEVLQTRLEQYSEKLIAEGVYVAGALTELGFDFVAAHGFVAELARQWGDLGRRIDSETAVLIELMAQKHYRICYQREQHGTHPAVPDMRAFHEAVHARRVAKGRAALHRSAPGVTPAALP